jgi:excisionase family DNA binding protein
MSTERMSFDEACRELGVSEAELEQLVAAGEIASIKDGDTLFFKKDVVRKFKKSRESEPTILLADDEINLLDDDGEIDLLKEEEESTPRKTVPVVAGKSAGAGKPGEGKGGKESGKGVQSGRVDISLDDEALPEIDLGEGEGSAETKKLEEVSVRGKKQEDADETLLNLDGLLEEDSEATTPVPGGAEDDSTLLDTDLLDLGGESDPFTSDTVEETQAGEATEQGTLLRGGGARVMQMKRKESQAAWTVILAVACVFLLLPLGVLTNLMFIHSADAKEGISAKDSYGWITEFPAADMVHSLVNGVAGIFRSTK